MSNKVTFPEEYGRKKLNSLYREVPLKDNTSRTLRKYFMAMANLYGVITLQKAYEIISSQSPNLVTKDEFLSFCEIAKHENENYMILSDADIFENVRSRSLMKHEIIDIRLIGNDFERYFETKRVQGEKDYYIPEKSELLKYTDPFYCEPTKEAAALREFIFTKLGIDMETAEYVFYSIIDWAHIINTGTHMVSDIFEKENIVLRDVDQVNEMSKIFQDFNNALRMQCNRGFTPDELFERRSIPENAEISFGPNIKKAIMDGVINVDSVFSQILSADLPNEQLRYSMLKELSEIATELHSQEPTKKVGRNEPCPCGSGKKYKHCCGKK